MSVKQITKKPVHVQTYTRTHELEESLMFKFTRRQVLKAAAAAAAMATVTGCPQRPQQEGVPEPAAKDVEAWHKSVCRYCGVGCGILVGTKGGKVTTIKGDPENTVNLGTLCVKAYYLTRIFDAPDRLKKPLIKKNGAFAEASWDEALSLMAEKLQGTLQDSGPGAVAFYGSGQYSTEEGYLANKLFKGAIGTNNVEGQPRTCMASAVAGFVSTFGRDMVMGSYEDIDLADVFFIIGSNTAEAHPVIFARVAERKRAGQDVQVIVVDPRRTRTFDIADQALQIVPGSDLYLLNAVAHVIIKEGLHDPAFMDRHVNFVQAVPGVALPEPRSWDEYVAFLAEYTPEKAAEACGLLPAEIVELARTFAMPGKRTVSMWTMGLNQRIRGTWVNNLLHNLHLITGKICAPGSTPLSLTGQPNSNGAVREVGALSHTLPAHRLVTNEKHRQVVAKIWGVPPERIQPTPGMHTMEMFEGTRDGRIKFLWVACTNPGHTLPNLNHYRQGMEKTFLVVSEMYHPTRTSELADIVLPAATIYEKPSMFTNAERRIQHMAKAIEPPGEAQTEMWMIIELAKRLGYEDLFAKYGTYEDVWAEWKTMAEGTGVDVADYKDYVAARGLQWPFIDGRETKRRYVYPEDPKVTAEEGIRFYGHPDGRARIFLRPAAPPAEVPDKEFPFWFSNGRSLEHWHSRTMTGKVAELDKIPTDVVEIHPEDAANLGVNEGDLLEISSRRGSITRRAGIGGRGEPRKGLLYACMHEMAADQLVNLLTNDQVDAISRQMEFKIAAVKITKKT